MTVPLFSDELLNTDPEPTPPVLLLTASSLNVATPLTVPLLTLLSLNVADPLTVPLLVEPFWKIILLLVLILPLLIDPVLKKVLLVLIDILIIELFIVKLLTVGILLLLLFNTFDKITTLLLLGSWLAGIVVSASRYQLLILLQSLLTVALK